MKKNAINLILLQPIYHFQPLKYSNFGAFYVRMFAKESKKLPYFAHFLFIKIF